MYISEQILFHNSNAAEDLRVLVLPVFLKLVEAHALLSVHEKRQPHSVLPRSHGLGLGFLFVCHGGQCFGAVRFVLFCAVGQAERYCSGYEEQIEIDTY